MLWSRVCLSTMPIGHVYFFNDEYQTHVFLHQWVYSFLASVAKRGIEINRQRRFLWSMFRKSNNVWDKGVKNDTIFFKVKLQRVIWLIKVTSAGKSNSVALINNQIHV